MSESQRPRSAYDRIAHLYDVDMARNMAFDDIALYRDLCVQQGGRVLELGCGNGRILLALLAQGIDAWGVDLSLGMLVELARKAAQRGLPERVAQMDARRLAVAGAFSVVLCPYSLVTYLLEPGDMAQLLVEVRRVLHPQGLLVVDAFVPRPVVGSATWIEDYRRAFGDATVVRAKRIMPLPGGRNRIERRYEVFTADGARSEVIETCEEIRPWTPDELERVARQHGFTLERRWWDYGSAPRSESTQFHSGAFRIAR
jgi:ubiquinone/menaquinone biosynthesis C-methylase UbiE